MEMKRSARVAFYTFSRYVVTHIIVFTLLPIGLMVLTVDREYFCQNKVYEYKVRFVDWLLKIVRKQLGILGLENVEDGKSYLIIANYPSSYTGFVLMKVFPKASIVVHAFMSRIPFLGHFLKRVGATFVDSKGPRSTKKVIDRMLMELKGKSTIILPEGQRTSDGQIQRFKRGFTYILRNSSLDLLPITLNGFYRLKPVNRKFLDPDAELELIVHEPISNAVIKGMTDEELVDMTMVIISTSYRP
jgi:1-acyl-sn-glycerol-3-phosphate acyltransferase